MGNSISEILKQVEQGKINCEKAIKLIKKESVKTKKIKKASKLKIFIKDEEDNTYINLPSIHFWFLKSFSKIGIIIAKFSLKKKKNIDKDLNTALNILNEIDLNLIFKELKNCGPFNFIYVQEGKDTEIKITVL
ncbi:hypothetical protein [Anaerosalibacter massiliensis]|uniref:Uncharacterized protein n=1 Tax=Anaerosalibacter massiliensis TaxID=1347392 RepID=A0A9X2S598_9FIRM|nr:hypothetical protein [Anaerosalibacter massiliensis]MCR2044385.1 hypothetical protein [Anaerosalibacter massiliensis]